MWVAQLPERFVPHSNWLRALLLLASVKVAAGLASYALRLAPPSLAPDAPSPAWNLVTIAIFGAAAVLLMAGGRRDRRAIYLGGLYMLIAAAFADRPVAGISRALSPVSAALIDATVGAEVDAFIPLLVWLFARDFPEAPSTDRLGRAIRLGITISLVGGAALFAINAAMALDPLLDGLVPDVFEYARRGAKLFHGWVLPLSVAGLPPIIVKARLARPSERRRVSLFATALAVGLGPVAVTLLGEGFSPTYRQLVTSPPIKPLYDAAIYLLLMSVPMTTTYAVVVERVLDVKLVVRTAMQYALTRTGVLILNTAPLVGLLVYLYQHRADTLTTLLTGPGLLVLLGLFALGLLGWTMSSRLLEAIDRRFFRERLDARGMLTALVESTRRAATIHDLGGLLSREIDRALHVDTIAVLVRDHASGTLIASDGIRRPLRGYWTLARLAAGSAEPLDVNLNDARSPFRRLADEEREWLSDAGCRLLVPMLDREATLVGLIALGEKKSELPFDRDDRQLLSALAASGALTIENLLLRAHTPRPPSASLAGAETAATPQRSMLTGEEMAVQCARCRTVYPPTMSQCPSCAGSLVAADIPYTLAGKFQFHAPIGQGGMGIVYLAIDLTLDRQVAIKTLPKVSPEYAMRLRREARVAASVSHPNLATIYGLETWRGTPMLIFEFVQAGTLADRLRYTKCPPDVVIGIGLTLADVLDCAHRAGIVHGDIKPSNIGFQRDETVKLLDFGVARLLRDPGFPISRESPLDREAATRATGEIALPGFGDSATRLFGTLAYLSPEALRGDPPSPTFDLWSLALVMYEALTGRNPFATDSALETIRLINEGGPPDVLGQDPACPPLLADFLMRALSRNRAVRPATAKEFQRLLQQTLDRTSPSGPPVMSSAP